MFTKKTVDSILSNFNGYVDQLRKLAETERETANKERAEADALKVSADTRDSEAKRATGVADKIAALVA